MKGYTFHFFHFFFIVNTSLWNPSFNKVLFFQTLQTATTCRLILFVFQSKVTVAAVKYQTGDGTCPTLAPPSIVCGRLITVECRVYVLGGQTHFCMLSNTGWIWNCNWLCLTQRKHWGDLPYKATRVGHLQCWRESSTCWQICTGSTSANIVVMSVGPVSPFNYQVLLFSDKQCRNPPLQNPQNPTAPKWKSSDLLIGK